MIERQQVGAIASVAVANRAENRLLILVEMLGERSVEKLHHGNVETIQPKDWLVARISMIVPGPGRRDNEIALVHDGPLAIDRGVRSGTLQHEAQRALCMPMRRRDLTRQHKLHTGVEIGGDLRLAAKPGIFKYKNTTFGFLCRNQSPRLQHRRSNLAEVPACRLALTARFRRDEIGERQPQRRQVLPADSFVKGPAFGRVCGRLRNRYGLHDISS